MPESPVIFDSLTELRSEIEEVAADGTLSPEERTAKLMEFRGDLTEMLGAIDTYVGDNAIEQAGLEQATYSDVVKLRENADIRERLVEAGELTDESADSLLLYSHDHLDELAEEGLLFETALHVASFMGSLGRFDPAKHPRGRGGKWADVLGKVAKLKDGETHNVTEHVKVKRIGGNFEVHHSGRKVHATKSAEDAARTAVTRSEMARPGRQRRETGTSQDRSERFREGSKVQITSGAHRGKSGTISHFDAHEGNHVIDTGSGKVTAHQDNLRIDRGGKETESTKDWIRSRDAGRLSKEERARVDAEHAQHRAEADLPQDEKSKLYNERRAQLEQRASSAVATAAARGKLTDAEAHFNDAGKVSQRTLANYVEEASTKPQTTDLYSRLDSATGQRVWDQSRRELHERIITAHLKQRKIDEATGKPVLDYSPDAPDLQPHPDGPKVLFSGGGYAAGKGGVIKILAARGQTPPDAFTLDPDAIKAELPEFQSMIGTDPEANMHVYREAWAIAQEVQARAMEKKLNLVVDGISNTSPEEMGQRARAFTSRGYDAHAVYVDIPTEEAMKRAANRAVNAKDDSDRRMIPEIIMRSVHRDVAATVPSLPGYLDDHQIPLKLEVWNNDQGKDEHGEFRPPKPFFSYEGGKREVLDQSLWDAFTQKGHETILHVDAPAPASAHVPAAAPVVESADAERRKELLAGLPPEARSAGEDHPLGEIRDALSAGSAEEVHVKHSGGDVAAAVSVRHSSPYADGDTQITHLGSTGGHGTELVRKAAEIASAHGQGLHAEAVPSAAKFYEKLGFEKKGSSDLGYPIYKLPASKAKKLAGGGSV